MSSVTLSSLGGVLSLLDESEPALQVHGLRQLDDLMDDHWPEIAPVIPKLEVLYEDEAFEQRQLAAVVVSKVFYHLEELDDALRYALGAGEEFWTHEHSDYGNTLLSKFIDEYIRLRVAKHDKQQLRQQQESAGLAVEQQEEEKEEKHQADTIEIDERLEAAVNRVFERCIADGEFKQCVGVALETRRLDQVRNGITRSNDAPGLLDYTFRLAQTVIDNRTFRHQLLRVLVELYRGLAEPDYSSMCQCLLFLDDAPQVAKILTPLLEDDDTALVAFQIAFDMYENQHQPFLNRVSAMLPPAPKAAAADGAAGDAAAGDDAASSEENKVRDANVAKLRKILSGETPTKLFLHFLYDHNKTDLNVLKNIKDALDPRNTITHNATVMAHAMMHVGTTVDTFLRDNLQWLSRANNWAKFTATASLGVIHKGHVEQSLKLLQPYLPAPGQTGSPYQEGGALYALGLIHANNAGDKAEYLSEALRNSSNNEIVQHGACLGLGLTAMGTCKRPIYDQLRELLFTDSAVAGEAAGLAMGLVLLGSCNGQAVEEMLSYAHDTKHEKIIRGIAMGLAIMVYGREEQADTVIEQMTRDKDPILRAGGMYAIALAYAGTANNSSIKKLLHFGVSDVSDDVRRAAVIALGFVLANRPEQVPRIVSLLSESFNPHVRYGACMAVGVACAGSGMKSALELLQPLLKDRVDYVRQGAFIAMSMVLIQHNKEQEPMVEELRKAYTEVLARKGDTMTKFGVVIGNGILDAGGRNVTIQLLSPAKHLKTGSVVGLAIFLQYWNWYSYMPMLSLAFSPTAMIGLNKDMDMPTDFSVVCNAPPSLFAYPPAIEVKKTEKPKIVPTAQLSVSAKAQAKAKKKDEEDKKAMDTTADGDGTEKADEKDKSDESGVAAMDTSDDNNNDKDESDEKKQNKTGKTAEAKFEVLNNPVRVTMRQRAYLTVKPDQRYVPVKKNMAGIVMLRDTTPGEAQNLKKLNKLKTLLPGISADEPDPPEPFEFLRD